MPHAGISHQRHSGRTSACPGILAICRPGSAHWGKRQDLTLLPALVLCVAAAGCLPAKTHQDSSAAAARQDQAPAQLAPASATEPATDVIATINGRPVTTAQFDAYLKHKNLVARTPEQRRALQTRYLDREAAAEAVAGSGALDRTVVGAAGNEYRKQLLISRYFVPDRIAISQLKNSRLDHFFKTKIFSFIFGRNYLFLKKLLQISKIAGKF